MILDWHCDVAGNRERGRGGWELTLRPRAADGQPVSWLREVRAGNFFEFKINAQSDPFLRRPFSLWNVAGDTASILYAVHGRGTALMTKLKPGDGVRLLGPLGNTFTLDPAARRHLMIAGGIGIAPFLLLARELLAAGVPASRITLLYGARAADYLIGMEEIRALGVHCLAITDDGSGGRRGFVTQLLEEALREDAAGARGYCCGPNPMFKAVQDVLMKYPEFSCQFSLESLMGCGIGVCNVCIIGDRNDPAHFRKVCKDGPVFDGRRLDFACTAPKC